ncbi:unnamed protein product [Effrenium voratum]|nr:unnamed protein product [Effrenium voratum]
MSDEDAQDRGVHGRESVDGFIDDGEEVPRPRPPGRPPTRGRSQQQQRPGTDRPGTDRTDRTERKDGRKVVYVDHHHVHHHHHFHSGSDWDGCPGDLPPEPLQRLHEQKAEAEAERPLTKARKRRQRKGRSGEAPSVDLELGTSLVSDLRLSTMSSFAGAWHLASPALRRKHRRSSHRNCSSRSISMSCRACP